MFSAIFGLLLLKEKIPIRTIICCIVCFGAILLIFSTELSGDTDLVGMISALFSSVLMGLYFVLLRVASKYEGCEPDMMPCNIIAGLLIAFLVLAM